MRHALYTTLGGSLLLALACGGPPTPEDTWTLAGDDTQSGGGDDTNSGGDDTGSPASDWVGTAWSMDVLQGDWMESRTAAR